MGTRMHTHRIPIYLFGRNREKPHLDQIWEELLKSFKKTPINTHVFLEINQHLSILGLG